MNSSKTRLFVALCLCGPLMSVATIDAAPFSTRVALYQNKGLTRAQLIQEYDQLKADNEIQEADEALKNGLKVTARQLKNAEEFQDTFAELINLYMHENLRRHQLISAYDLFESDDEKLLGDQILNVRLRKSIAQLRADEQNNIPEYSIQRPAISKKPSKKPSKVTKRAPSKNLQRASRKSSPVAQTAPRQAARSLRRGAGQIRMESGLARTQKDINNPSARIKGTIQPTYYRKRLPRKPLGEASIAPGQEAEKVELPEKKEDQKVLGGALMREQERLTTQNREAARSRMLASSHDQSSSLSDAPRSSEALATEMKRRLDAIKAGINPEDSDDEEEPSQHAAQSTTPAVHQQSAPAGQHPHGTKAPSGSAEVHRKIEERSEAVANSILERDRAAAATSARTTQAQPQATAQPRERLTRSKRRNMPEAQKHEENVPEEQSPQPKPEQVRVVTAEEQAAEMSRRMAALKGAEKNLRVFQGKPVIPIGKEFFYASHEEFNKNLSRIALDNAVSVGRELAGQNLTDQARWNVLKDLVEAYKKADAPKAQLKSIMRPMIQALGNKNSPEYLALPEELKK